MHHRIWQTLLHVRHPNEDTQRRGRNLIIVALGLIFVAIVSNLGSNREADRFAVIGVTIVTIIVLSSVIVAAQRGFVTIGAFISVGFIVVALLGFGLQTRQIGVTPFFFITSLLVAGVTLRPWGVAVTWGCTLVAIVLLMIAIGNNVQPTLPPRAVLVSSIGLCCFAGLGAVLGGQSTERALRQAQAARDEARQAAAQLTAANAALDARIAERTAALNQALKDQELRAEQLEAAFGIQQQLSEQLLNLSIPVIPIRADVLVVPLVGSLDSLRSGQLLERLLGQIEQQHTRVVFLDVTGVPVIDTQAAAALLQTAAAARLLGANLVLVGLRPEVAQALVHVGADLGQISTYATLQQGLEAVH